MLIFWLSVISSGADLVRPAPLRPPFVIKIYSLSTVGFYYHFPNGKSYLFQIKNTFPMENLTNKNDLYIFCISDISWYENCNISLFPPPSPPAHRPVHCYHQRLERNPSVINGLFLFSMKCKNSSTFFSYYFIMKIWQITFTKFVMKPPQHLKLIWPLILRTWIYNDYIYRF